MLAYKVFAPNYIANSYRSSPVPAHVDPQQILKFLQHVCKKAQNHYRRFQIILQTLALDHGIKQLRQIVRCLVAPTSKCYILLVVCVALLVL